MLTQWGDGYTQLYFRRKVFRIYFKMSATSARVYRPRQFHTTMSPCVTTMSKTCIDYPGTKQLPRRCTSGEKETKGQFYVISLYVLKMNNKHRFRILFLQSYKVSKFTTLVVKNKWNTHNVFISLLYWHQKNRVVKVFDLSKD